MSSTVTFFPRLLGQPLRVRFEDVSLRLGDHLRIARVLAEPLDKLCCVGAGQALPLLFWPVLRPKPLAGTNAP